MMDERWNEKIPNWTAKRAFLTPDRTAVIFHDEKITFRQLFQEAKKTAEKLFRLGCGSGKKAAVLLKNRPESLYLLAALQLCGTVTVFLNHRLTPGELLFQLKDSGADLLVADETFREKCEAIRTELSALNIVYLRELDGLEGKPDPLKEEFALDDVCSVMYTSGTTGFPKGVLQTYGNHWWSAVGSVINLGLAPEDAWALAVPLFHISGFSIFIRSLIYGIPVVLYEKFEPERINRDLREGKISIISLVPQMLSALIEGLGDGTYHERLRCVLLGGGPAPVRLLQICKEKGIPVYQTYGLTETCSQIVTLAPEDSLEKIGSAGKPLFPNQLRIVSPDDPETDLAPKQIGEIAVKGPVVMKGYYRREESNAKSFLPGGWFLTGDLGYVDEEGFLYVVDRRADLIISGGENIYPAEIENVLLSHPSVQEACVVGVDDEKWGQVPFAFYVRKKGCEVGREELEQYCRKHLASYKVPKGWEEVDRLPRNAANKLMRRELKKLAKELR